MERDLKLPSDADIDTPKSAQADTYLFNPQQRREIQTRAKWAAIDGRTNASATGASCGPIIDVFGNRQQVVPRGNKPSLGYGNCPWTTWEECYAIPGTNYYLRLALECHSLQPGYCPIKVTQKQQVMHFNITIAQQGWLPDNFNYNNPNGRRVLDDEHIAIWTEGGKTCVSWYADVTTNLTGPGQGEVCRWSSCGTPPPGIAFSPWTIKDAVRYFQTGLQGLGKLLEEVGIAVLIVEGIILLIGSIVILAMVILAAATAGTALAILAL